MKKVSDCFADSELFPIFATAILVNWGVNAHLNMLHYKQKRTTDIIWKILLLLKK